VFVVRIFRPTKRFLHPRILTLKGTESHGTVTFGGISGGVYASSPCNGRKTGLTKPGWHTDFPETSTVA